MKTNKSPYTYLETNNISKCFIKIKKKIKN